MKTAAAPSEPMPTDPHEAASEWVIRRHDAGWSAHDEAELQRWLLADPAHREVFERLSGTWGDFAGVPRPVLASEHRTETVRERLSR